MADDIKIVESSSFSELMKLSNNGQDPLYIPITNGDNSGADPAHPDYYRLDIMAPELSQIANHFNEKTKDEGVRNFISMVFRSRNIEFTGSGNAKCSEPSRSDRELLQLPNGGSVWEGSGTFDFYVLRLCYSAKLKITNFNGNVTATGDFGSSVGDYLLDFLPENIDGNLYFNGTGRAALKVAEVSGSCWADGVDFEWTPQILGASANSWICFYRSSSIPNLAATRIGGNLVIQECDVNESRLPTKVQGHCVINFCKLGKMGRLPITGGNLDLSGNPALDLGNATGKVGGNLLVPSEVISDKTITEEQLRRRISVQGEIVSVEDSKVKRMPKSRKPKGPNAIQQLAMDFVQEFFGSLGVWLVKTAGKAIKSLFTKDVKVETPPSSPGE